MNIGIDLGGSHIAVGLVNEDNEIIIKKEHNWKKEEKKEFTKNVEYYCKKLIRKIINENNTLDLKKIGIGYPSSKIINGVITIDGKKFNLTNILSKEFNVPVYLKNDVKCSSLCEKRIGNLSKYDNCIFMTLGTGIGGAYYYKNELVEPNIYQGIEIGHMIIETDGRKCRCGLRGCFEEYASMRVFRREIEELFGIEALTSYKMFELIESKQKKAEINKIIDRYVKYLSIGIINLIKIFEPDSICIGGSFTYYADIFMEKLNKNIRDNLYDRQIPDLLVAKYGNDAGIIGAAMLELN